MTLPLQRIDVLSDNEYNVVLGNESGMVDLLISLLWLVSPHR